jgi:regulator of nucleoside diphosphate kinase
MQTGIHVDRQLTELDSARLRKLLLVQPADELERVLDEAEVVRGTQVHSGVITMYTQFELEDLESGQRRVLAICYPDDAEPSTGFISVLSPLGRSAIGLRAGSLVSWRTPAGAAEGRISAVLFQPEASGDYLT